ncbi:MAG TPA: hypothetical protein VG248_09840 [Caulobacteraceae bacterium]|nr:hypothetical protein [Caulobacteraceae bacterium]
MSRRFQRAPGPDAGEPAFLAWLALASLALAGVLAVAWPVRPVVLALVCGAVVAAVWALALRFASPRRATR